MAANQEQNSTVNTPFPNPPIYWQSFTRENVVAYETLNTGTEPPSDIPEGLKNLRPPTPPKNGEYIIFGEKRSLASPQKNLPEETPLLQPATGTSSSPQHLLNLTRSLMLSYLELLHIMAINPEPPIYGIKWEDLRDLFKNAHYALNTYRPWQARDALIKLLEETRDNARAELEGVQILKAKVDKVLHGVAQNCEEVAIGSEERPEHDPDEMNGLESKNHKERMANGVIKTNIEEARRLWALVNENSEE